MHNDLLLFTIQITALENNDDDQGDDDEGNGSYTNSSDSTSEVKPTDSSLDDKMVRPSSNQPHLSTHICTYILMHITVTLHTHIQCNST